MPLRGETVGTAFVRILADGSELGPDIEKQMREHEDAFRAAGKRNAKSYAEAFDDEQKDSPTWQHLTQSLNRAIARSDATADFFNSPSWKNFQIDMEKRFGPDIGRRLFLGMESEFRQSGSLSGLTDEIEHNLIPRVSGIVKQIGDQNETLTVKVEKDNNRIRRSFSALGSIFRKTSNDFGKFAEPVGSFFGRGSRNNFVNFFGSVITNALKFGDAVFSAFDKVFSIMSKMFGGIAGFISDWRKHMDEGASAAQAFFTTISAGATEGAFATLATGGLNLVVALGTLVAALGLVAFTVGVLISALLLLSGIVIALAATIEFALIAAAAALGPVLVALVPLVLGVVAVVKLFKKSGDKLKPSIDRLKNSAKDLWKTFKDAALKNAPDLIENVGKAMKELNPIAKAAGTGFSKFADIVVKSFTGPEWAKFLAAFTKFLPDASAKLGTILSNTFEGFAGILRASIPLATRLLDWLVKITDKFSVFTNTPEGQHDIRQFLKNAADSAESLWHFIGSASTLIQKLLTGGQETGNNLFDSMADALDRVSRWLDSHPDALKNFFIDAQQFATALGHAIEDIVAAIDKIDTPQTRRAATVLIEVFGILIIVSGQVIFWFQRVAAFALKMVGVVVGAFVGMAVGSIRALQKIVDAVGGLIGIIPGLHPGIKAAVASFDNFADKAVNDLEGIENKYDNLTSQLSKTPSLDIDTSAATNKLSILGRLIASIQQAIANAQAHAAAVAQNHGTTNTDPGPHTGGSQPVERSTADRVTINVITPTTNPKAVAVEAVNRLVAIGFG